MFEALISRGVIVRNLAGFGLPHCLRISTGSDDEMSLLFESLAEICGQP